MAEVDRGISNLDSLYREVIMDHHKNPSNFGVMKKPTVAAEAYNPLCGDRVKVELHLDPKKKLIKECMFHGEGCAICMASASMMTEAVTDKKCAEAVEQIKNIRAVLRGEKNSSQIEGDLSALIGVKDFPVRIKCALLPWTTLQEALNQVED